ncbi:MAG: type VI secretion system tip protein VgrG [Burkholderiales bacterium]|nr:type VI secretion system tip protein VgrG [Burkholderiales bacterium]
MERLVDAETPLGSALWFRQMTGTESLSELFEFDVTFHSITQGLSAKSMLGQSVTLKVETEDGKGVRHFNGICTRFSSAGKEDEHLIYTAKLRPWLWIASRRSDCKIFQFKTVPEIIDDILARYPGPTKKRLTRTYRQWDYCVQYQETDLNFVMRLMEHEGIYFYFEHSGGQHTLVLCDDMSGHSALAQKSTIKYIGIDAAAVANEEHFNSWTVREEVDSGEYFSDDYDFEHPKADLKIKRTKPMGHSHDSYQRYVWPGGYVKHGDGDGYADVRIDTLPAEHERAQGHTTVRTMAPGYTFTLERCPRKDQNREYLAVAATYFFRDNTRRSGGRAEGDSDWSIMVTSQPTSHPYRPQHLTPKPRTHGPQTAVVVGPKGEEIYTDQYGRVKVHFHWDRYDNKDENSSCWIRVATPWAGEKWGMIHIPRIGQEVVVDFIGGDPDYPLITGSVYNADQMPPYGLPENKTAAGLKSRSTKGASATDFNEIRMEDMKGKEQLYVHAQKNLDTVVENDESHVVGHDRNTRIGNNDSRYVVAEDRHVVGGNQSVLVNKNQSTTVKGNQDTAVSGNQSNMVTGSVVQSIGKTLKEKTSGDHRESIGGKHTFIVSKDEKNNIGGKQSNFIQGGRRSVIVGKEVVTATGKSTHFSAGNYSIMTPLTFQTSSLTRKATVLANDQATIAGTQTQTVGISRSTTIGAADTTRIGGVQSTQVGGASSLQAVGAVSITAGAAVSITGGAAVTVQGATVTVTAATINLIGVVNVLGMLNVAGVITTPSIVSATYTPGVGNLV